LTRILCKHGSKHVTIAFVTTNISFIDGNCIVNRKMEHIARLETCGRFEWVGRTGTKL